MTSPVSPTTHTRRTLRLVTTEGVSFSVMVGVGETYLPAFVLALGLSAELAGLIATLPMVSGSLLQLLAPWGLRLLPGYRAWVVLCASVQAASFIPLLVAALLGGLPAWVLFAAAALYWTGGMSASPAWNAWVAHLVPLHIRPHYFGRRQSLMQLGTMAGLAGGGAVLHAAEGGDGLLAAFGALFATACAMRAISAALLRAQPPVSPEVPPGPVPVRAVLRGVRRAPHGKLLRYVVAVHGGAVLAAPFFTPYLLLELELDYAAYMLLMCAVFAAKSVSLPYLGRLAQRVRVERLLLMGAFCVAPLPLLWSLAGTVPYLLLVQLLSGFGWGAIELATFLILFNIPNETERSEAMAVFHVVNAPIMAVAAAAGAALLAVLGGSGDAYLIVFVVSSAARFAAIALLRRAPHVEASPRPPAMRVVGARPSSGAVLRPVRATYEGVLDQDERED